MNEYSVNCFSFIITNIISLLCWFLIEKNGLGQFYFMNQSVFLLFNDLVLSLSSLHYMRSGAETPRMFNPLAIVIFTALINATRADVSSLFVSSRTFSAL